MINRQKSHHSQHSLKYPEIRIITRRTIYSKLNGFKDLQIIRNHFFCSSGHHFRFILKGSAPKSTKNHYFRIVQCGNIQNPGQPLLMDFQEFPVTDFYRPVTVTLVEPVVRPFPQVRCCTGDHIHRVPIFFRKRCRCRGIGFEYNDSRRIDAVIIVDRILHISVRRIKSSPHFLRIQAEIQRRTTAQTFLLGRASLGHTTSGIRR